MHIVVERKKLDTAGPQGKRPPVCQACQPSEVADPLLKPLWESTEQPTNQLASFVRKYHY